MFDLIPTSVNLRQFLQTPHEQGAARKNELCLNEKFTSQSLNSIFNSRGLTDFSVNSQKLNSVICHTLIYYYTLIFYIPFCRRWIPFNSIIFYLTAIGFFFGGKDSSVSKNASLLQPMLREPSSSERIKAYAVVFGVFSVLILEFMLN